MKNGIDYDFSVRNIKKIEKILTNNVDIFSPFSHRPWS